MNLSVIVGSCDAYSPLWKNFDILFQKYWQLNTKNYIVSETVDFDNNHYTTITPGQKQWGERILEAVNLVDTPYIYILLEDYYLIEPHTKERINYYISIMEKYNSPKMHIDSLGEEAYIMSPLEDDIMLLDNQSKYLTSLQPGIWKTEFLKQCLKPEYSPWDMEVIGTQEVRKMNVPILMDWVKHRRYFNLVRRGGNISPGWEQLFIKENLQ